MTTRREYLAYIASLMPYRDNSGGKIWRLARMPQFTGSAWCGATHVAGERHFGIDFTDWITARQYIFVPDIIGQAKAHGMWQKSVLSKPGDVVTMFGGGHTERVWSNNPRLPYIHTIGGNTSDGVHKGLQRGIFKRTRYRSIIDGTVDYSRYFTGKPSIPKAPPAPGKLVVDGVAGPKTIDALQRLAHTPRDGIVSTQPVVWAARFYSWSTVEFVAQGRQRPSPVVKWIQHVTGDTRDGYVGPSFARHLQKYVGVKQDSIPGPITVRALQVMLNAGTFGK